MTFRIHAGRGVDSPAGCEACRLGCGSAIDGTRPDVRLGGAGPVSADVLVAAEFPRDGGDADGAGPFGLWRIDLDPPAPREHPLRAALRLVGFKRRDLYATTAIKCAPDRRRTELSRTIRRACLVEHLGVELEYVQPPVVWVTGYHGATMVREFFPGSELPRLDPGGLARIEAPEVWRPERLLVVRSPHPAAIEYGFEAFSTLATLAEVVASYVRSQRRRQRP